MWELKNYLRAGEKLRCVRCFQRLWFLTVGYLQMSAWLLWWTVWGKVHEDTKHCGQWSIQNRCGSHCCLCLSCELHSCCCYYHSPVSMTWLNIFNIKYVNFCGISTILQSVYLRRIILLITYTIWLMDLHLFAKEVKNYYWDLY